MHKTRESLDKQQKALQVKKIKDNLVIKVNSQEEVNVVLDIIEQEFHKPVFRAYVFNLDDWYHIAFDGDDWDLTSNRGLALKGTVNLIEYNTFINEYSNKKDNGKN